MKKRAPFLLLAALAAAAPRAGAYDNISMAGAASFKKVVARAGGVAALPSGDWLVSDASAGVLRLFGPDGKPKGAWGVKGKGADQLLEPRGLAVDADGDVYAVDAGHHRVAVFSAGGKFLRTLGGKGAGAGQLSAPSGVAVSRDGVVYVADTGNHRVQVFSRDGLFLLGFGAEGQGNGQFKGPSAVAVDPLARVHVMDNQRVQSFDAEGGFLSVLDRPRLDTKDKEPPAPVGLAADAFGALYVAGAHQKIEEYGPDGKYIASFGTYGTGPGQFKELSGLFASAGGVVLALDGGLDRVQGFKPVSADRPAPLAPAPTLRFSVSSLGARAFLADDVAFGGDLLAGVAQKSGQLLLSGGRGAGPVKAVGDPKSKGAERLQGPAGLFVHGDKIFVAEAGGARVVTWSVAGKPSEAGTIGSPGKRDGQFKEPRAVAVDAGGRIFVADPALNRVQVFSPDGIFLRSLPGPFESAVDVAPLPGKVAVLDAGRKAVLYFDEKGRAVGKPAEGFLQPVSIAADPRGKLEFVYVLDAGDGQVKIVSGGSIVARFGSPASLKAPKALAVDDRGVLWVADAEGVKGFLARLSPLAPADFKAEPGEGQVELSWKGDPEKLAVSFNLYRSTRAVGGDHVPYKTFASTETSFLDREIVPGLAYHYQLSAVAADADGKNRVEGSRAGAKAVTQRPANLPPVDIASMELGNVFSAQYKFYERNPVGIVVIKNNTEKTFQKIRVGFTLQNYMDFVTEKVIDRFEAGSLEPVELKATFNNKILSVTEDTPVQAQLTITYYDNGEEKVFKRAEPITVFSRNAMSWEDPRRLATFITAKDPAVLEFARGPVRDFHDEIQASPVNPALAKAAVVFEALGTYGLSYLKDPNNPFEKAAEDAKVIDYVQYPRETLKRKTGDCDDLTALAAALLESVSVPTAVVDVPGHVLLAFQLDEGVLADPGLPEGSFIERDGALWIPLEATFIGKSFVEAWEQGAKVVRNTSEDRLRLVEARDAWLAYAPSTLPEEPGPASPKKEEVSAKFPEGGLASVAAKRLETLTLKYEAAIKADPADKDAPLQLGLVQAEHGFLDKAATAFDGIIARDPAHAAALNNRANVHWLKGEAAKAAALYAKAAAADPRDAGVRLNLARAALKAGDAAGAKKAFDEALELDPSYKKDFTVVADLLK